MKFSFQIPIPNLDEFLPEEDFHFALAHLAIDNTEYIAKYNARYHQGDLVVLDNGTHEGRLMEDLDVLDKVARSIGASAIIPPDKFFNDTYTLRKAINAVHKWGETSVWPVVQARSPSEAWALYKTYYDMGFRRVCL